MGRKHVFKGSISPFFRAPIVRLHPLLTALFYYSDDERIHLAGILSVQPSACAV